MKHVSGSPFTAILVNGAPSGEVHNYCTPHIIKKTLRISWPLGATIYSYLKCTAYDKLLKPRRPFLITLYKSANDNLWALVENYNNKNNRDNIGVKAPEDSFT